MRDVLLFKTFTRSSAQQKREERNRGTKAAYWHNDDNGSSRRC